MSSISIQVNNQPFQSEIDDRMTLADLLRNNMNLTGTHLACELGVCGSCTVLVNDEPIRSCITLAASVSGMSVQTIEGFEDDDKMKVIRECFSEAHGLQCGFCTPGMLITVRDMIIREKCKTESQIRKELSGNLCRCTGYSGIVKATQLANQRLNNLEVIKSR
ncbi:MAG: (2Fe-2S)-binding protein [Betaproteobacteria bacterium]